MSRLEELVAELCPNGVEYKSIGEICNFAKERIDATLLNRDNYIGVENLLPDKAGKTFSNNVPTEGRFIKFEKDDILIGNIRPYLRKIWLADCVGGTNGDVIVLQLKNSNVIQKFLYHNLAAESFFMYYMATSKGAKMPRGDKKAILQYEIPIPPLIIQEEIVKILDNFTELTAGIVTELTEEINKRKKQFQYYRDFLLTFDKREATSQTDRQTDVNNIKWKRIKDVCKNISSGGTPSTTIPEYYGGTIPWLRTQEVDWKDIYDTEIKITESAIKNSSAKIIPSNCIIVAMYGATAAKVAINKISLSTNQACCNLEIDESVALYRYVFHWLSSQYESLKHLGQGSQSNINASIIKNYTIPIPSLAEQASIVDILDRFDILCNDLTSGLHAEITTRKKQYEYYRDNLLSFKEKRA